MKDILFITYIVVALSYFLIYNNANGQQFTENFFDNIDSMQNRIIDDSQFYYVRPDSFFINQACYLDYKIIPKESGSYYCIQIYNKEYKISDILDYGDFDLKVYKRDKAIILLIGLIDFYESVYFIYYFENNKLARLGQINIKQPSDVEEHGMRPISFKIFCDGKRIILDSFLAGNIIRKSTFGIQ